MLHKSRSPRGARRVARALAVLIVLLMVPAAGRAAETAPTLPELSPGFAADIIRLPVDSPYGAFVNFYGGDAAEHKKILRAVGLRPLLDYEVVEAWFAVGPISAWRRLTSDPRIAYLQDNARLAYAERTSKLATNVAQAQLPFAGGPYRDADGDLLDGSGIGVAIVDSGVDGTHPDLKNRVVKNFTIECESGAFVWSAGEYQNECFPADGEVAEEPRSGAVFTEVPDSDNSSGHGTHVAGIVAGDGSASFGTFQGMAPGASLYAFGAGEGIHVFYAADAFRWIWENGASQNPPIRIVSNSWGCDPCDFNPNDVIAKWVNRLVDRGMLVVFAAGNSGGTGTTNNTNGYGANPRPGVVGVANYNDNSNGDRNFTLSSDSSRGLSTNSATWPDISAPGTFITAACTHTKPLCQVGEVPAPYQPYYASISGTSMAAPYLSGIAALMLQAKPSLTPGELEDALIDTAHKFPGGAGAPGPYVATPRNPDGTSSFDKGAGLVDATAALTDIGASRPGIGFEGTPTVTLSSPADGASLDGPITVTGTATDGATGFNRTMIDGDGGDYQGAGANDIVSLQVSPGASGITYTIGVRNLSELPPNGSVGFGVFSKVSGVSERANVNCNATGCTPSPTFNATNNTAPSTAASRDLATNTVSVFVPHASFTGVVSNTFASDTYVISYAQAAQDIAPGLVFGDQVDKPRYADPYNIKPVSDTAPGATVKIAIDGVDVADADVTGSSPSYSWTGDLDLSSVAPGAHTLTARLRINGALRATQSVGIVIPNRVLTPDPVALTFADQRFGTQSGSQTVTVTNDGLSTIAVGSASTTGPNAGDFTLTSDTCSGTALAAGASCAVHVAFAPTAIGSRIASLTVPGGSTPAIVSLGGTGIGPSVALSATSLTFDARALNTTSAAQTVTVTNDGTDTLLVGTASASGDFVLQGDACSGSGLAPSASCTIDIAFHPTGSGFRSGSLSIPSDAAGSPHSVSLSGTGLGPAVVGFSPSGLTFAAQDLNTTSAPKTVTVTNAGGLPLTFGTVSFSGADASQFRKGSDSCSGRTINGGATCAVTISFRPTTAGPRSASLDFPSDATGSPHSVPLAGTGGRPKITFSPSLVNFGTSLPGSTSAPQTITVSNPGALPNGPVTVTKIGSSTFTIASDDCTGATLAPGGTCTVAVTFTPSGNGSFSGTLRFANAASGSPHSVLLAGNGDSQPPASRISTRPGSILIGGVSRVEGSVADNLSQVSRVSLRFESDTTTAVYDAELRCSSPSRCTWSLLVPDALPEAIYDVTATASDSLGNTEVNGPSIPVIVI